METRAEFIFLWSASTQKGIFFYQFVFCVPALLKLPLVITFFGSRFLKTYTLKIENKQEYHFTLLV